MERITESLIAPCGMNCGVCIAHLRDKNVCPGCRSDVEKISCLNCQIRLCDKKEGDYCFDCKEFPCARLKQLDKRYKAKYSMSEIDNLVMISKVGVKSFVKSERKRWESDKGLYCVHNKKFY